MLRFWIKSSKAWDDWCPRHLFTTQPDQQDHPREEKGNIQDGTPIQLQREMDKLDSGGPTTCKSEAVVPTSFQKPVSTTASQIKLLHSLDRLCYDLAAHEYSGTKRSVNSVFTCQAFNMKVQTTFVISLLLFRFTETQTQKTMFYIFVA